MSVRSEPADASNAYAARRFVLLWCAAVSGGVLVLFPAVTLFLINWFDHGLFRWIAEIRERKFRIAEKITAPGRILIVGGSSGVFGLDAELIEARLQRPTVNLTSHAGLGLRFLLDEARPAARPGDTVLLNIEYSLYRSGALLTDTERRFIWTYAPARLFRLPLPTLVQQLYGNPGSDYARSWQLWDQRLAGTLQRSEPAVWQEYSFVRLGPRGDFRGEVRPTPQIQEPELAALSAITPEAERILQEFFTWARGRGIHLAGVLPGVLRSSAGEPAPAPIFAIVREFYAAHGLAVLGDPAAVQMPRELFLDTNYHTNSAGRRLRTEALARELQAHFGKPPSSRKPALFLLHDPPRASGLEAGLGEFSDCRYFSGESLQHPWCVTPAQVASFIREGTPVYYTDPGIDALLPAERLHGVSERRRTSTLADWVKAHPRHLFLLSTCGGARGPSASSGLPPSFAKFLNDSSPVGAAILGTGPFARVARQAGGSDSARVKQAPEARWQRAVPFPMEYRAAAARSPESRRDLWPVMVQREPLFEWPAEGDLAVCIVDPHLGAVVKRGIFRDGQHLEYELKRIVAD